MKRIFSLAIVPLLLLSLIGFLVGCHQDGEDPKDLLPMNPSPISKFLYKRDGEGITITGYSGIESMITIPSEIDGWPVRAIAENAFRSFTYLSKVYLPDSVETIDHAFVSCPNLTYVRLGKGIVSMNGAFRDCTNLSTVDGAMTARYLDEAFYGCRALTAGTIPAGAISARAAYASCTSLKEVRIEEGISALIDTFRDCRSLKTVTLPDSLVETVSAFSVCTSLHEVLGGNSLAILDGTFAQCPLLTSFTLSPHLAVLKGAFVGCTSLATLSGMPESLNTYASSFTGCRSLTSLLIPAIENKEALAAYHPIEDLRGCEKLTTVVILADFAVREEFCKVFAGCSFLESVTLPDEAAVAMLRLSYTISDTVFDGTNKALSAALEKWKKASAARETEAYATINGVSFTHIYGGDIDTFDMNKLITKTDILSFKPFEKVSYWCGYPDSGSRKEDIVGIQRTFSFFLRTTGRNDGTLPEALTVNGLSCSVGE